MGKQPTQADTVPKAEKQRKLKKNSKRKKKAKREAAARAPTRSDRNYVQEMLDYVEAWERREQESGWKFNKVLQNWAIDHVFDRKLIKKDALKPLLRYLKTVQGSARQRIVDRAREIVRTSEAEDADQRAVLRANRVLSLFPDGASSS